MAETERQRRWRQVKALTPEKLALAERALEAVIAGRDVTEALQAHPLPGGGLLTKAALVAAYRLRLKRGAPHDPELWKRIRMKPVRTLSGVATVTVLTKPYPCPGKCIFCPDDVRMPKSYLPDEPGAMRGLEHDFDPYAQVSARVQALADLGHPVDKVELLILGGTWSAYRRDYQEWFVRRCFDALNGVDSPDLPTAHARNETAARRCVGLTIETRPDEISPDEVRWLRALGVTRVQLGAQSLDDRLLALNCRGHTVSQTRAAAALLRAAGFKLVLHWMPNLLGATPESDRRDFARLWDGLCPDEIKIYPTQLLENTPLYARWQAGEYRPYDTAELVALLADLKATIPRYCRVNRVIRDIPSTHVVAGNRRTSLRQDAQAELARRGLRCQCVRCREVRGAAPDPQGLALHDLVYPADFAEEHFLSGEAADDRLAGFLRLSLPAPDAPDPGLPELRGAALIREVHVYGQALAIGESRNGAAQHAGLGTRLLEWAAEIARARGYRRMAVIASVGTRGYYLERGFRRGEYYLLRDL